VSSCHLLSQQRVFYNLMFVVLVVAGFISLFGLAGDHSNRALALMADEIKIRLFKIPGVQQAELTS
jgi:hypothetical protein